MTELSDFVVDLTHFVAHISLSLHLVHHRVNKSKQNEQRHSFNFALLSQAFFFARMLLQEDSIFHALIGLFSLIHLMIRKNIFIELAELLAAKEDRDTRY